MNRLAVSALITVACASDMQGNTVPVGPGDGILFVGNSLTFTEDLPGLVEGLARAVGRPLRTAYLAALVIAAVLTGASPQGMPARVVRTDGTELSIPADAATILQAAASEVSAPSPRRPPSACASASRPGP